MRVILAAVGALALITITAMLMVGPDDEVAGTAGEKADPRANDATRQSEKDGAAIETQRFRPKEETKKADAGLRVRVVDAHGRSASDVPVILRQPLEGRSGYSWGGRPVRTAADGTAKVPIAERLEGSWDLTFAFPLRDPPVLAIDVDAPPPHPVTLTLPETGSLLVRCLDPAGKPAGDAAEVELKTDVWPHGPWQRVKLGADGSARLPRVGLGLVFELSAKPRDRSLGTKPSKTSGPGPVRAGEEAMLVVTFGAERLPVLVGRFVDENGKPLPAGFVAAIDRLEPGDRKSRTWQRVTVDDQGRFRLVVRFVCPPNGTYVTVLERLAADGNFLKEAHKATVDLAPYTAPVDHEIGDVVLGKGPVVLAGRCVDQNGAPVDDVELVIGYRSRAGHWIGNPNIYVVEREGDGRFRVHWHRGPETPTGTLDVKIQHPMGIRSADFDVEVGSTGRTFVITLGGGIAGSLELDGASARTLSMFVKWPKGARTVGLRRDGGFEAKGIEPGTVDVYVLARGGQPGRDEPLAVVEGVVVPAGRVGRDPRLQGLAVASPPEAVTLSVVDVAGRPVSGVIVLTRGDRPRRLGRSDREGRVHLVAREAKRELILVRNGYRTTALSGLEESRTVTLRPGLSVKLVIAGLAAAGDLEPRVRVRLSPATMTPLSRRHAVGPWQPRGDAVRCLVPEPGTYRVDWGLEEARDRLVYNHDVKLDRPTTVTVLDRDGEQTFQVTVPAEAVRATWNARKR